MGLTRWLCGCVGNGYAVVDWGLVMGDAGSGPATGKWGRGNRGGIRPRGQGRSNPAMGRELRWAGGRLLQLRL